MMDPADTEAPPVANFSINRLGHSVINMIRSLSVLIDLNYTYGNPGFFIFTKRLRKKEEQSSI